MVHPQTFRPGKYVGIMMGLVAVLSVAGTLVVAYNFSEEDRNKMLCHNSNLPKDRDCQTCGKSLSKKAMAVGEEGLNPLVAE